MIGTEKFFVTSLTHTNHIVIKLQIPWWSQNFKGKPDLEVAPPLWVTTLGCWSGFHAWMIHVVILVLEDKQD